MLLRYLIYPNDLLLQAASSTVSDFSFTQTAKRFVLHLQAMNHSFNSDGTFSQAAAITKERVAGRQDRAASPLYNAALRENQTHSWTHTNDFVLLRQQQTKQYNNQFFTWQPPNRTGISINNSQSSITFRQQYGLSHTQQTLHTVLETEVKQISPTLYRSSQPLQYRITHAPFDNFSGTISAHGRFYDNSNNRQRSLIPLLLERFLNAGN